MSIFNRRKGEFKIRDEENKQEIDKLNKKIIDKNNENEKLNDIINTCQIREKEVLKKEEHINELMHKNEIIVIENFKNKINNLIVNTKGNISKGRICELINNLK